MVPIFVMVIGFFAVLFGLANIIYPVRKLGMRTRGAGGVVLLIGLVLVVVGSLVSPAGRAGFERGRTAVAVRTDDASPTGAPATLAKSPPASAHEPTPGPMPSSLNAAESVKSQSLTPVPAPASTKPRPIINSPDCDWSTTIPKLLADESLDQPTGQEWMTCDGLAVISRVSLSRDAGGTWVSGVVRNLDTVAHKYNIGIRFYASSGSLVTTAGGWTEEIPPGGEKPFKALGNDIRGAVRMVVGFATVVPYPIPNHDEAPPVTAFAVGELLSYIVFRLHKALLVHQEPGRQGFKLARVP